MMKAKLNLTFLALSIVLGHSSLQNATATATNSPGSPGQSVSTIEIRDKATTATSLASTNSAYNRPNLIWVKSPQTLEQKRIMQEALTLLTNKDYAGLDALASKYRTSKESYADGVWKLNCVYDGLDPARQAPDATWQSRLDLVADWISARTNSITAHVAKVRLLTGYAWQARGSGWAATVTESQWKKFFERLQQSARALKEADELPERCPVLWSSLQRVALGLEVKRESYDAIFAAAIKEFPDYSYCYVARAIYLLPRWNGTEGEWERDLTRSANRIGGEKGDMLYAQTVWYVNHYGDGIVGFKENRLSLDRLEKGFAGLLKIYPDSLAAKSEIAHLACIALDKEKARKYVAALNGKVDDTVSDKFSHWFAWLSMDEPKSKAH